MGEKVQRVVRFETWMVAKIEELSGKKEGEFSRWVNRLLRQQLEGMGFTEGQYEAEKYQLGTTVPQERAAPETVDTPQEPKTGT
jgi:hypothetical protein